MSLFCICKHTTHALIFSDSQYISESLVFVECLVSQSTLDVYYYFQWQRAGKEWFHFQLCQWGRF